MDHKPIGAYSLSDTSHRRHRHPKPPEDWNNRFCVVCGDKAVNFNFGQISCESCKAFFRRNATKEKSQEWKCINNGDCKINRENRKRCASCRLDKCIHSGMDPLLIKVAISSNGKYKQYSPNSEISSNSLDITSPPSKSSEGSFEVSCDSLENNDEANNIAHTCQFIIPSDDEEFPYIHTSFIRNMTDRVQVFNSTSILPQLAIFLKMDRTTWLNNQRVSPYSEFIIEKKLEDLKTIVETKLKVNMTSTSSIPPNWFQSSCSWNQIINLLEVFVRYSVSAISQLYEFKQLRFEDKIFILKERIPSIILPTYFAHYRPETLDFLFNINDIAYAVNPMAQIQEICSADTPFSGVRDYSIIMDLLHNLTGGSTDLGFAYLTIKLFLVDTLKLEALSSSGEQKFSQFLRTSAQENAERYIILLYQGLAKYYPNDCDIRFEGLMKLLSFSEKFDQILSLGLKANASTSNMVPPIMKEILGAAVPVDLK